jgi:hypothetical protein
VSTTTTSSPSGASALATLPSGLRRELLAAFGEIVRNFRERRWEPAELNGGKLCEIVYTIIKGYADGRYPTKASKPRNMLAACQKLETDAAGAPRSIRIQIPRMLVALYEIRNNRNVGHVGGDVDPNHMDAVCVLQMSKWIMAELVRVLHNVSTDEATSIVDSLVERDTPLVWEVNGKRRVLDASLKMRDKTLLLLHSESGPVSEKDLVSWLEHSNPAVYRRDILRREHRARRIEYDEAAGTVQLSPTGIAYVEETLLPVLGT